MKGWSRHQHFGLREEWLALVLADPEGWAEQGGLGNRQVQGLRVWLKTTGLLDAQRRPTQLWQRFAEHGVHDLDAWAMLWGNVVHNFPTAAWYVLLPTSDAPWTTTRLVHMLAERGLAEATRRNAILELAGLLERTPVGRELGQGMVEPGRPRRIHRPGMEHPPAAGLEIACRRCVEAAQRATFSLHETLPPAVMHGSRPCPWPWTTFGSERQTTLRELVSLGLASLDAVSVTFRPTPADAAVEPRTGDAPCGVTATT